MNLQLFNMINDQYTEKTLISENSVIEWTDGASCLPLPSLKFYGHCDHYSTPSSENPAQINCTWAMVEVNHSLDSGYLFAPPLYGIGEYRDEWDYVTKKGIRRIAKKEFTGTEGWQAYGSNTGENGFYSWRYKIPTLNAKGIKQILAISTHFPSFTSYGDLYYGKAEGVYAGTVNDTSAWVVFGTTCSTAAEFKNWVKEQYEAGTPLTVYYVLAEPEEFEDKTQGGYQKILMNKEGYLSASDSSGVAEFEITYITHP